MQSKQSQYTITYDDFNDSFLCAEILTYIAKLFSYEPKHVYSVSEFISVLERDLGISINCCFEA